MTVTYNQTDTAAPDGIIAAGSGLTVPASTADCQATSSGLAGSTSHTVTVANSSTGQASIGIEVVPAAGTTWSAGNWTIGLDVTASSSGSSITLTDIYLQHVDGSGVLVASLAHATPNQGLGTNQVYSLSVTGAAAVASPGASDKVYIVLGFSSSKSHGGAASITVVFSQTVTSPFTASTIITGADTGTGAESSGPFGFTRADSAHGREAAYSFGGDWGHAAESASVAAGGTVPVSGADSAHGAEHVTSVHVALTSADTSHAAETASAGSLPSSVGFDSAGPSASGYVSSGTGTPSWSHVVGASATMLLAWLSVDESFGAPPAVTAKAGTTSMVKLTGSPVTSDSSQEYSFGFYLLNPPTGTVTISFSIPGYFSGGEVTGGSMSFTGAGALGTPVTVSGQSAAMTLTVPGVAVTSMVAAFMGLGDVPVSPSPGTSRFKADGAGGGGGTNGNSAGATNTGTGSVSVIWTTGISADTYCGLAVEVKASASTPVTSADTGHMLEGASVHAALSKPDTGHGLDTGAGSASVHVTLQSAESAAAASGVPVIRATGPQTADSALSASQAALQASLPGTDTGHAAESGPRIGLSGAENASAVQGVTSTHASLSGGPDSAHAAEQQPSVAPTGTGLADAGHAVEAASVHATLTSAESVSAAQGVPVTRLQGTGTADSALSAAQAVITAHLAGTDSAHAADVGVSPAGSNPSGADNASAAEHSAIAVTVPGSDTGHAVDRVTGLQADVSAADDTNASFTAGLLTVSSDSAATVLASSLHVTLASTDVASATETGLSPSGTNPASADSALAAETGSLHVTLPGTDTGHATENGSAAESGAQVSGTDTGHAADFGAGTASIGVPAADSTNAHETQKITADISAGDSTNVSFTATLHLASPDSVHAAEHSTIRATLSGSGTADSAHASEAASPPGTSRPVSSTDSARATESAFYEIRSSDTAQTTESLQVSPTGSADSAASTSDFVVSTDRPLNAWPGSGGTAADTATSAEAPLNAWPASQDAFSAAEAHGPFPVPAPRSAGGPGALADEAVALEVTHEIGIWTYIPVNVRLEGRFWRITGRDEHGSEIVILEAERLSRAELEYAERVARGPVRMVGSADCCQAADRVSRPPIAVIVWVRPAVQVAVSVSAVPTRLEVAWT